MGGPIRLELEGAVASLALARPERRNALNEDTLVALEEAVDLLHRSPDLRVLVLSGDGPSFCAGADLAERAVQRARPERRHLADRWQELFDRIERLPQVTLAAMQGAAIGGGLLLALTCDVRLAADNLVVRLPEVALGVPVSGAGMPRLVRELGLPRARDLVLTGRSLTAGQAYQWGLVTEVVDPDDLAERSHQLAGAWSAGPPDGLRLATRSLRSLSRLVGWTELAWADVELASYRGDGDPE